MCTSLGGRRSKTTLGQRHHHLTRKTPTARHQRLTSSSNSQMRRMPRKVRPRSWWQHTPTLTSSPRGLDASSSTAPANRGLNTSSSTAPANRGGNSFEHLQHRPRPLCLDAAALLAPVPGAEPLLLATARSRPRLLLSAAEPWSKQRSVHTLSRYHHHRESLVSLAN